MKDGEENKCANLHVKSEEVTVKSIVLPTFIRFIRVELFCGC